MFKKLVISYDHRVDETVIKKIKDELKIKNIEVIEVASNEKDNDYPILASLAYQELKNQKADGMILLCGTGIGMNMVANKFDGIRAVLATEEAQAYFSRRHENANCLVFGVGYADQNYEIKLCKRKMIRILNVFLETDFEGDRHIRRLDEIAKIEKGEKF